MKLSQLPWASGPGEILRHGLDLLKRDSDTNRRLAMISIDNAVELMLKTYLGLPKRINGLAISRKEFQDAAESFPAMLDLLEKYAAEKLDGIDLGAIEWYHRLRNELYHQGNGLTAERDKVEIYAELANSLFNNLFGAPLVEDTPARSRLLGEFMAAWTDLEMGLCDLARTHSLVGTAPTGTLDVMRFVRSAGIVEPRELDEINELRRIRNQVAHGAGDWESALSPAVVDRLQRLAHRFREEDA